MATRKFKRGMTLVETLIAILIFSLGMLGVTMLFSRTWKINSFIIEEGNEITAISQTLNETIRSLRGVKQADNGAYPIKSIGDFDLVVYLNDDGDDAAERVHYFLENGDFKKGITNKIGNLATYPDGDETVKVIARNIVNTSDQPIFKYYNKFYPIDLENNPMQNPKISEVRLVEINLWMNMKPITAPDNINFSAFAELRNLNVNN